MALFSSSTVILALALLHFSVNAHALPSHNIRSKGNPNADYLSAVTIVGVGLPRCVGTLIGPKHILTARNCVLYPNEDFLSHIMVIAGTTDLHEPDLKRRIYMYPISITVHREYDIAILEVGYDAPPIKNYVDVASYKTFNSGDKVTVMTMMVDEKTSLTNYDTRPPPESVINKTFTEQLVRHYLHFGDEWFCEKEWAKHYDKNYQLCSNIPKKYSGIYNYDMVGGGVIVDDKINAVVTAKSTKDGSPAFEAAIFLQVWHFSGWIRNVMKHSPYLHDELLVTCEYDNEGYIKFECNAHTYEPIPGPLEIL